MCRKMTRLAFAGKCGCREASGSALAAGRRSSSSDARASAPRPTPQSLKNRRRVRYLSSSWCRFMAALVGGLSAFTLPVGGRRRKTGAFPGGNPGALSLRATCTASTTLSEWQAANEPGLMLLHRQNAGNSGPPVAAFARRRGNRWPRRLRGTAARLLAKAATGRYRLAARWTNQFPGRCPGDASQKRLAATLLRSVAIKRTCIFQPPRR